MSPNMKKQKPLSLYNEISEIRIEANGSRGGYNVTVSGDAGVYDKLHGYVDTAETIWVHSFSAVQEVLRKLNLF